jgi:hypothetical protein
MATLDEFESRLQALLEVHLLKYLPGYRAEDGIAQQLAAAMHGHLKEESGQTYAPNIYTIVAHPTTMGRWHARPDLLKELANALYHAGIEAGFLFSGGPVVTTASDENMPVSRINVLASFGTSSIAETQATPTSSGPNPAIESGPNNAFLIVNGTQVVPLNRSVINIGRRLDNHIVIDDGRVSRAHAQLRIIRDHFVIFDLNSSGGTFVNGHRINQSALSPGDVISLAGVSLIFGQDLPAGDDFEKGHTSPGVSFPKEPPKSTTGEKDGPVK